MFHQVNAAFKYKHVHNRNTREQKWIPSLLCNFVFIIITRSYSFVFKCKDIIKRKLLHHWVHFVDLFIRPDDAMSNSWRDWVHLALAAQSWMYFFYKWYLGNHIFFSGVVILDAVQLFPSSHVWNDRSPEERKVDNVTLHTKRSFIYQLNEN